MIEAIQKNMTWRAVPIAGFAAGTVFLSMNMALNPTMNDVEATFILRYFAAMVLGSDVLMDISTPQLIVGVLVHYVLSLVFTLVIAIVIHRWGLMVGIIGGAILGLAIYAINFYTMTVFFEWMFAIRSPLLVISHVVFGAVAGGVYESLDSFDLPFIKEESAS